MVQAWCMTKSVTPLTGRYLWWWWWWWWGGGGGWWWWWGWGWGCLWIVPKTFHLRSRAIVLYPNVSHHIVSSDRADACVCLSGGEWNKTMQTKKTHLGCRFKLFSFRTLVINKNNINKKYFRLYLGCWKQSKDIFLFLTSKMAAFWTYPLAKTN